MVVYVVNSVDYIPRCCFVYFAGCLLMICCLLLCFVWFVICVCVRFFCCCIVLVVVLGGRVGLLFICLLLVWCGCLLVWFVLRVGVCGIDCIIDFAVDWCFGFCVGMIGLWWVVFGFFCSCFLFGVCFSLVFYYW